MEYVSNLTQYPMKVEEIIKLLSVLSKDEADKSPLPFEIGEKYFIRTVTHYMVGKLDEITGGFLVFSNASWIADTGRFNEFLKTGEASEVEPVKGLYRIAIGAIVDAFDFKEALPSKVK